MRNSLVLRGVVLFLAALSPAVVYAQFQQPTDEELKMTADPKAPGAAAVYLDFEEIANDPVHFQSCYARIKVLTEKGKELATVELPYWKGTWKITDIKGRTIHADGTIVPLTVKPEDLLGEKSGEKEWERKVFTLPSVEVGSILEYSYELRYDDQHYSSPQWQIQRPYFVHKVHYSFTPFKAFMPTGASNTPISRWHFLLDSRGRPINSLLWWYRLPAGVAIKTSIDGSYSVDLTDIPPAPDEEWMPPVRGVLFEVNFYYSYTRSASEFWMSEGKLWSKDVDKFAEPSKAIKAAINGLVAPTDSDLDKAKKLYLAVQALDNTDFSRVKTESERKELDLKQQKRAEDTWAQKSGSSQDIALLYLAMLRAAGLKAYALTVADRSKRLFDPTFLSLSQLTENLVILKTGDKETALDPGQKMCPFGTLSWKHAASSGLREDDQGVSATTTPYSPYTANAETRTGNLAVDSQGTITGRLQFIYTGQQALRWRQRALRNDETELKKQFDKEIESEIPAGVEAHVDHFLGLDDPDANLMAMVNVTGSLGEATSKRLMIPGAFFKIGRRVPFVQEEKRETPVDMHYGDVITDQTVYRLPEGMTIEGAPPDTDFSWSGHARFLAKSTTEPGQITIVRSFARSFTFAKPEEYQDLRGFYQKVAAANQEQLVLTSAPAAPAAVPAARTAPATPAAPVTPVASAAPAGKGN